MVPLNKKNFLNISMIYSFYPLTVDEDPKGGGGGTVTK